MTTRDTTTDKAMLWSALLIVGALACGIGAIVGELFGVGQLWRLAPIAGGVVVVVAVVGLVARRLGALDERAGAARLNAPPPARRPPDPPAVAREGERRPSPARDAELLRAGRYAYLRSANATFRLTPAEFAELLTLAPGGAHAALRRNYEANVRRFGRASDHPPRATPVAKPIPLLQEAPPRVRASGSPSWASAPLVAPVPHSALSGPSPAVKVFAAQTELATALRPVVAARLRAAGMPAPDADLQGLLRALLDQREIFKSVVGGQFGLVDAVRHDRNRVAHAGEDFSADDAARAPGRIEALLEAIEHTGA